MPRSCTLHAHCKARHQATNISQSLPHSIFAVYFAYSLPVHHDACLRRTVHRPFILFGICGSMRISDVAMDPMSVAYYFVVAYPSATFPLHSAAATQRILRPSPSLWHVDCRRRPMGLQHHPYKQRVPRLSSVGIMESHQLSRRRVVCRRLPAARFSSMVWS